LDLLGNPVGWDVFGDMEGEEYICNTWMDEVCERAKTIQNTRSAMNV